MNRENPDNVRALVQLAVTRGKLLEKIADKNPADIDHALVKMIAIARRLLSDDVDDIDLDQRLQMLDSVPLAELAGSVSSDVA